jgi:hypothetical protein
MDNEELAKRRRRSPRISGPFKAQWRGVLKVPLVIQDLSIGGCFVLSNGTTIPAQRMTIELHLSKDECIIVDARPLYVRKRGFAVQFMHMNEETYRQLQKALARLGGTNEIGTLRAS